MFHIRNKKNSESVRDAAASEDEGEGSEAVNHES